LCEVVKGLDPTLPVLALAAPGPATDVVEAWNADRGCIDHVVRKPLSNEALFGAMEALASERHARERAGRYAGLIPLDGRRFADAPDAKPGIAEMAVLFTDIRRSTEILSTIPLPEWFAAINRSLSDQSEIVHENGGSVVKYTGDGLLASFRGRGRAHMALRSAAALQELDRKAGYRDTVRIGIGVAEGLVMTGFIGVPGLQQYDVIGASVHLAARLCSLAAEGEIVATPRLVRSAGFDGAMPPQARSVKLRGFEAPIECVSYPQIPGDPSPQRGEMSR
jgi:class 3 adenylate cyclase